MITHAKMKDVLMRDGIVVQTIVGKSMYPMLRNRKDVVVISRYKGKLKKYDIPLYQRDDKYVLHRIVEVKPEYYVIVGDNCINKEYVKEEQIIGVLTDFYRGERKVDMNGWKYKIYVYVWCALFPVRYVWKKARYTLGKILKSK